MTFTDIIFVFLFLPLALAVYFIGKTSYRKCILLFISLVFYACGTLEYFAVLLCSLMLNILLGYLISKIKTRYVQTGILIIGIVYNISILGYYKYADFIGANISILSGEEYIPLGLALPLGISFFIFKAISYLVDVYSGKIEIKNNPVHVALYLSFFAQVQSGPLSRYETMEETPEKVSFDDFSEGVSRFIIGFNKKILLSNVLANITVEVFAVAPENMSVSYAWLGAICYALQLYYDFSGYSDMAIGLSGMFGYKCPENFNYPYMTSSISEFWRRWHITLGAWFRDYIYIPLGGSRVSHKWQLYVNLFMVWLLTGIWHGANWTFVFWGLGYFVLIAFEKTTKFPQRLNSKLAKFIYRVFSLGVIVVQWVIFNSTNMESAFQYLGVMFGGAHNELAGYRTMFLLKDNCFFIIAAILCSFPIVPYLEEKLSKNAITKGVWNLLFVVVNSVLFIWAISFVVAGQNTPFLYANF